MVEPVRDQAQGELALAVILVALDGYGPIGETLRHLGAQTARARLELVIVARAATDFALPADVHECFGAVRMIEAGTAGDIEPVAAARAAGIRQATTPIVALTEDHAYPAPGWAAALIAAHGAPWAAVGPTIGNANPDSGLSWANLLLSYGRWLAPVTGGVIDDVPGHNSSYKRASLLSFGPALEGLLEREGALHRELRAAGYQLYLETAARTDHQNFSRLSSSLALRFHAARLFGASRASDADWSRARRLLYCVAGPLLPLLRLRALLPDLRRVARAHALLPRIAPALIAVLLAHGVGEVVGYAWGAGTAPRRLAAFEFDREQHLARRERRGAA